MKLCELRSTEPSSEHVIKARDSRLALVDVVVEGFISKPLPEGTQLVELPTFKDPQSIVEEITSSDEEAEIESEDNTLEENTENPVLDEDFKAFYHTNEIKEEGLSPHPVAALVTQQRRGGKSSEAVFKRRSRVPNWNPIFELDGSPLHEDSSIRNFDGRRAGYVANVVEQALLLPKDMNELRNLKKH
ncbi:hypothetical protein SO802_028654 [Lithocarpus litseifolius]|uniref:Uncharacterized protein n=1 Tax=Lithocarpus litseifolius TaxID=425828 RepID=A0AAW2BQW3_9ROSI